MRKWWEITGFTNLMIEMSIFTLTVQSISLLQLVSFYCTSLKISGAKRLKKSRCKAVVDATFLICIGVLSLLYSIYFSLVLVWFILGAVLNP